MMNQGRGTIDLLLAESFKELACKQTLEKITIKAITDKAGVIRPTFYNHFQDKYELLEWIIYQEVMEPARLLLNHHMIDQALVLIFVSMEKDKEFYCNLAKTEGQNSLEEIARKHIRELFLSLLKENLRPDPERSLTLTEENLADYYAQSICFVILNWLKSGMEIAATEMAQVCMYIMKHSISDLVNE